MDSATSSPPTKTGTTGKTHTFYYLVSFLCILAFGWLSYTIYTSVSKPKAPVVEGMELLELVVGMFKIVPILVNAFTRFDHVINAFASAAEGTVDAVVSTAEISTFAFTDTFSFGMALAKYLFKTIMCGMENVFKLHKCILFYLLDMVSVIVLVFLTSVLELIDDTFQLHRFNVTLLGSYKYGVSFMDQIDDFTYDNFNFHCIHYPDFITNLCYTCSNPPNVQEMNDNVNVIEHDLFVKVPELAWPPISKFIDAGEELMQVFQGLDDW